MKRKEEADLLTVYTDHLLGLSSVTSRGGPPASTRHDQVHSLLTLADHLHAILAPVEPDPHFRRRLHGELILKAQNREEMPEIGLFQPHRRSLVIGAALGLGSVASVLGVIIAVLLRRRAGNVAAG
ncbi:MAG: hypothetical protein JXA93_23145 [Anaerolineae bacterium]|nr:hypothetical protein [Anaerolineae bacterium]